MAGHWAAFARRVAGGEVEVYNEFSLQHEFGIHLRCQLPSVLKVQFERPVGFFQTDPNAYPKKEIDIAIYTPDRSRRLAVELKCPRNGQYPEQMLEACRDVAFLERLVAGGFEAGMFVILSSDALFWSGSLRDGIYRYFRAGVPIHGAIRKPTGAGSDEILLEGTYQVEWADVGREMRAASVVVGAAERDV